MDSSNSMTKKAQLQALLSKIIHDIYIVKLKGSWDLLSISNLQM